MGLVSKITRSIGDLVLYKGSLGSLAPLDVNIFTQGFDRVSLSDYINIDRYIEDVGIFVMKNGYIGVIYECFQHTNPSGDMHSQLTSFFGVNYPLGSEINFFIWASDFLEPFSDALIRLREKGNFWAEFSANFILSNRKKGPNSAAKVPIRDFKFFISFRIPVPMNVDIEDDSQLIAFYRDNENHFEDFYSRIEAVKFFPRKMNDQDLLALYYMLLNPNHNKRLVPKYSPTRKFSKQIMMSDSSLEVQNDLVYLDRHYCSAYTIKEFPEDFTFEDTFDFIGSVLKPLDQIECPFFLSFSVRFDGHHNIYEDLSKKHEKILKQKFGTSAFPKLKKRQEEAAFINDMMVRQKLVRASLVWWLYTKDRKNLKVQERKLEAIGSSANNFELQRETGQGNLVQFLQALPLNSEKDIDLKIFKRYRTMFDYNAAHLTPYSSDWKGTGTAVLYFISRRGQIMSYNLFDTPADGYNFVIVARTGAGKSFLANHIISGYYSLPDVSNIWIIDIGGSYETICQLFNGNYIDFTPDADITINPFDIISDIEGSLEFLTKIYGRMAKSTGALSDNESNILMRAIRVAYSREGSKTCVDTIYDVLSEFKNEEDSPMLKESINSLRLGLEAWKSDGVFGQYVNGRTTVDISNKLTVLELKGLEGREHLRQIMLMMFLYLITNDVIVKDDRTKKKIAMIDEFWKYVNNEVVVDFVRLAYKTWRKHGASMGTITQNISDYFLNPALADILNQAAHKFFLKQTGESINAFEREGSVDLQKFEFNILRTVTTVPGKYSEIYFITPLGNGVGRLIVDRNIYWLYTSSAKEVAIRKEKLKKYKGDVIKAIKECVEEYG